MKQVEMQKGMDNQKNRYLEVNLLEKVDSMEIDLELQDGDRAEIYLVEAKKIALSLQNLGQLLIYCKLFNPEEAYLLSSSGLGSLKKVLNTLNREDLLDYEVVRGLKN